MDKVGLKDCFIAMARLEENFKFNVQFNLICKSRNIRENFFLANIRKFVTSQIQSSR